MADYKLMKENGAYVRKMLKKRRYDDASLTGWGRLDELSSFNNSISLSFQPLPPA